MEQLSPNWVTEGKMDFEHKKYLLLAYLNHVQRHFEEQELYPFMSDLVYHYNNLLTIRNQKKQVKDQFPEQISKIDLQNFKVEYEKILEDEDYMEELESILNFAIPKVQEHLEIGKNLYEEVESKLRISPVGIVPLRPEEGYLFVKEGGSKQAEVYEYTITIFERSDENYRGIKMQYIMSSTIGLGNTFENLKQQLIKNVKKLPNPATYVAESEKSYPFHKTLMPIVKRQLMRYIAAG